MTDLSFDSVALPLVIEKLPLPLRHQPWIAFGTSKARTTQADSMTEIEGSIGASPIDLIGTDHRWILAMAATIGSCLGLHVFSFIVEVVAQLIQERKANACHRDGDLYSKCNVAPCLATHDRPDGSLIRADDPLRSASAVRVVDNSPLADNFADHQQLLVPVPTGYKKTCHASDQGIDAGQFVLQMAKLLLDGLSDLADARPLLLGHGQKRLPGFLAMRTRLESKVISDLRVHRINQFLDDLSCLIEKGSISRVPDVWCACGVDQHGTLVGRSFGCRRLLIAPVG